MIAEIRRVDAERRAVFGWAPSELNDAREAQWYKSLQKSCSDAGSTCDVGSGDLIEFFAGTSEKFEALGVRKEQQQPGICVGVLVRDNDAWRDIQSGVISQFELDFHDGVRIRFPVSKQHQEVDLMCDTFRMRKDADGYSNTLIAKCSAAVERGDLSGLTRDDFGDALDSLAKNYSAEYRVPYAQGYEAILSTPRGSNLYDGYNSAPPAARKVVKQDAGPSTPAMARIEGLAVELRKSAPGQYTPEAAFVEILRRDPTLYNTYLLEVDSQKVFSEL